MGAESSDNRLDFFVFRERMVRRRRFERLGTGQEVGAQIHRFVGFVRVLARMERVDLDDEHLPRVENQLEVRVALRAQDGLFSLVKPKAKNKLK